MQKITMKREQDMTIGEGLRSYLRWCKLNNYSEDTLKFYEEQIHLFSLFYDLDKPLSELTCETVEDYTLYLRDKNLASTTIHCYMRGFKTIVTHLMRKGMIDSFDIVVPKSESVIKEVYTEAELKKLLKKPNLKTCKFIEYRNWVIVNYLLGTGQRRKTVVNIKIGDLDLVNKLVRIRVVKNKKPVILPLTNALVNILDEYLSYRGGEADDYLFCGKDGKPITSDALTNTIRKYNISRGVDKTSVHLFRHTFAYMSAKNDMEILRLQQLMCHSKIDTTQRYLRCFGFDDLQENYELYNPLEVFSGSGRVNEKWKETQKRGTARW